MLCGSHPQNDLLLQDWRESPVVGFHVSPALVTDNSADLAELDVLIPPLVSDVSLTLLRHLSQAQGFLVTVFLGALDLKIYLHLFFEFHVYRHVF